MLRNNFHTILCMSPIGDMLRIRCRMFPSLVNCCTLIWFQSWPLEALSSVAQQYLMTAKNIPYDALISLFPLIHESVETQADLFFMEIRRKTYITPKSFLDCISLFLSHLETKRTNFEYTLHRLENGVLKLNQTN